MADAENTDIKANPQTVEIKLESGTVVCPVTDDPCGITIKFRHPDGTETRIAGMSQMDPKAWGPSTFRVYISQGEDYYTESRIVTITPEH